MAKHITTRSLLMSAVLLGVYYAYATDFSETTTTPETSSANSFSQMENLDRNIEAAGREISALKMNNELKILQDQADKMKTDFVVTRIYGLDNNLKASLKFNNNSTIEVQKGDIVENHYHVTEITQTQVTVYDKTSGKAVNVPFDTELNTKK